MPKRSPEELAGLLGERADRLEELLRDANGCIGELSRLLREHRQVAADGEQQVRAACDRAADEQLHKWFVTIQAEMNRNTAALNEAVQRARKAVIRQLKVTRVSSGPDGLRFYWEKGLFEDDAEFRERLGSG